MPFARYKGRGRKDTCSRRSSPHLSHLPALYVHLPCRSCGRNRISAFTSLAFLIYPAFRLLFPNQVIRADDLARAMVDVALRGTGERGGQIFENHNIRAMVENHFHTHGVRGFNETMNELLRNVSYLGILLASSGTDSLGSSNSALTATGANPRPCCL